MKMQSFSADGGRPVSKMSQEDEKESVEPPTKGQEKSPSPMNHFVEKELTQKKPRKLPTLEEDECRLKDKLKEFTWQLPSVRDGDGEVEEQAYCVRWSNDNTMLAASAGSGNIYVFGQSGRVVHTLNSGVDMPITILRWRPTSAGLPTTKMLLSASADGKLRHWHVPSQKVVYEMEEDDNQIFAIDYQPGGEQFATGGRDKAIRIYDEQTKDLVQTLEKSLLNRAKGHSNRIFALKYKPDEPNILLSGSWDDTIQIWDLRSGESERVIFGPHVAGDALDIQNNVILSGSWRNEKVLETWDYGTGKNISAAPWKPAPMMYAACFHPSGDGRIACGGTGVPEARICNVNDGFRYHSTRLPKYKGVYSVHYDRTGDRLAVGGNSSTIKIVSTG